MVERQVAKHLQLYQRSGAELIMGGGCFVAHELNTGSDDFDVGVEVSW
jgi:hypothetical protein